MEMLIVLAVLVGLILCGMWVQMAVGVSALLFLYLQGGWFGLNGLGFVSWGSANSYTLSAIPLFVLMAEILLLSGVSARLYNGMAPLLRRLPGGLLHTNIVGCGLFAAISGGSAPTAAAMGTVALPELSRHGYDKRLSAGSLAAGGTLGILIPPSITMIVYAMFTDTSIAKLFMAGLMPGLLLAALYMGYLFTRAVVNPALAPAQPSEDGEGATRYLRALGNVLPFVCLIALVLGTIYGGVATPTEAAALGVVFATLIAFGYRALTWRILGQALRQTVVLSGSILFIVFTSMLFAYATTLSGMGERMAEAISQWGLSKYQFLFCAILFYSTLGCFMEGLGMIAITVPILQPVLSALGIDPVWFGVFVVILVELGQLTPPLGVILFVVSGSASTVRFEDVVRGVIPFYGLIITLLVALIFWPQIALWLPATLR